jgi:hypothetical protein
MELRRAIKGFSSGFRRGFRTEKQSQESLHSVTRTGDKQAADIWNDDLSWPVVVQAFRRAATARNILLWIGFAIGWGLFLAVQNPIWTVGHHWDALGSCIWFGALSVAGFHIVRVILWKIVPAVPGVLKALLALGILVVLALLAYRIVVFAFTGRFHL